MLDIEVSLEFANVDGARSLVGAIELSRKDILLASQALRNGLVMDDALGLCFTSYMATYYSKLCSN